VTDAKFCELRVLDELKGNILEEVFDLSRDLFHGLRCFLENERSRVG
jgi:hypothetical protein